MVLYLIRHAQAGQHGDPHYPDDRLRPLTKEGRKRFREVCRVLAERGIAPALVATSPLVRCRQTAEILVEVLGGGVSLVELDDLAPGGSLDGLVAWAHRQSVEQLAWVGHAPDVELHLGRLIGESEAGVRFAKGAIAAVEFAEHLAPGHGRLQWLVTARLLGL